MRQIVRHCGDSSLWPLPGQQPHGLLACWGGHYVLEAIHNPRLIGASTRPTLRCHPCKPIIDGGTAGLQLCSRGGTVVRRHAVQNAQVRRRLQLQRHVIAVSSIGRRCWASQGGAGIELLLPQGWRRRAYFHSVGLRVACCWLGMRCCSCMAGGWRLGCPYWGRRLHRGRSRKRALGRWGCRERRSSAREGWCW